MASDPVNQGAGGSAVVAKVRVPARLVGMVLGTHPGTAGRRWCCRRCSRSWSGRRRWSCRPRSPRRRCCSVRSCSVVSREWRSRSTHPPRSARTTSQSPGLRGSPGSMPGPGDAAPAPEVAGRAHPATRRTTATTTGDPPGPGPTASVHCSHLLPPSPVARRPPAAPPSRLPVVGAVERRGRGDRIRTCGLPLPKRMRYQAALHPGVALVGPVQLSRAERSEAANGRVATTDGVGARAGRQSTDGPVAVVPSGARPPMEANQDGSGNEVDRIRFRRSRLDAMGDRSSGYHRPQGGARGRSSMVEPQSSKLITRVRFSSPAPHVVRSRAGQLTSAPTRWTGPVVPRRISAAPTDTIDGGRGFGAAICSSSSRAANPRPDPEPAG